MRATFKRRLAEMEHWNRAQPGLRVFIGSFDDRSVFFGNDAGRPYTLDEIHALDSAGWWCVTVMWVDDWRSEGAFSVYPGDI